MDLRQLHALVAVADHGTFSAAAEALATVQSNVSAHVAKLERGLGTVLVDRATGRLTAEGEVVVERARRVEAELDALVADVAALRDQVTGRVRVGIIGTTARWLAPRVLEAMADRHPGVQLVIVDATSTSLEPQLVSGRLDLAVVNLPLPAPEVRTDPLFDEDLLLFVPAGHPLAEEQHDVGLEALEDLPLLLPPQGTSFRDRLDDTAAAVGITLRAAAELDGLRLIASLTIAGYGAAVLPATAIPEALRVNAHPVRMVGLPRREVGLAQRRRGLPGAPARALRDVLVDVVRREAEPASGLHPRC